MNFIAFVIQLLLLGCCLGTHSLVHGGSAPSTSTPKSLNQPSSPPSSSETSTSTTPGSPSRSPSRILLMPFPWKSHVSEFKHIGEALVQRGHQVHIVLPSHFPGVDKYKAERSRLALIEYLAKYPDFLKWSQEEADANFENMLEITPIEDFRENIDGFIEVCYNVLESEELEQQIRELKFDLVILDGFICTRCFYILAYRLGLPYISVTTQYEPWLFRAPAVPSFVPFPLHVPPLTPEMSFLERVSNLWCLVDWTYRTSEIPYLSNDLVTKYAPEQPAVSLNNLASKSLLWLFDTDISIDYPRPMMPNEINIGGLSVKEAKPLPEDLDQFVSAAKSGTIIASFGSNAAIPEKYMLKMLDAFNMLSSDYHVVFRWDLAIKPPVNKNIRLMDWVPQNNILGHKNAKLFLTHSGANGQFEALYHAVPMVNFPSFGDQPYNARRADYHGFSETIDVTSFTAQQLFHTIMKVLSTPTYREKIAHASSVFGSQLLNPRERAAWWVEHVLQYGGQHLHAHALDMPAYKYLMLDILACLLLVASAVLLLCYCMCGLLIRRCRKSNRPSTILMNNNSYEKVKST